MFYRLTVPGRFGDFARLKRGRPNQTLSYSHFKQSGLFCSIGASNSWISGRSRGLSQTRGARQMKHRSKVGTWSGLATVAVRLILWPGDSFQRGIWIRKKTMPMRTWYVTRDTLEYADRTNPDYLKGRCKSIPVNLTAADIVICANGTGCADGAVALRWEGAL